MAAYKMICLKDSTDNCVRRMATIEIRRYNKGRGHITITLESGWGNDRPVLVKRTGNKNATKQIVREFLSFQDVGNFYKRAKILGM